MKKFKRAPGAGRPKLPYKTKTIRVPLPLVKRIVKMISVFREENNT